MLPCGLLVWKLTIETFSLRTREVTIRGESRWLFLGCCGLWVTQVAEHRWLEAVGMSGSVALVATSGAGEPPEADQALHIRPRRPRPAPAARPSRRVRRTRSRPTNQAERLRPSAPNLAKNHASTPIHTPDLTDEQSVAVRRNRSFDGIVRVKGNGIRAGAAPSALRASRAASGDIVVGRLYVGLLGVGSRWNPTARLLLPERAAVRRGALIR